MRYHYQRCIRNIGLVKCKKKLSNLLKCDALAMLFILHRYYFCDTFTKGRYLHEHEHMYSHICFYNNQSGEEKFDWFLVSRHYLPSLSRSETKNRIPITQTSIVKQACGNKEYVTGRSVDKWSTTNDLIAHFSACIHLSISTYPPVGVCLSIFLSI